MFDYNLEIDSVENVIKEVEFGRENKQKIYFNGETCYNGVGDFEIDTLNILRALQRYEVKLQPVYHERDFEYFDIEDYLGSIFCGLYKSETDNTYNYNQPLSNHLNTCILSSPDTDWIVYAVRVHLCGDVRGNYSPWMVFSIPESWDLGEIFSESSKQIPLQVDGWEGYASIDANGDGEIYVYMSNDDGEDLEFESCACDLEELKEEIKKEIENL